MRLPINCPKKNEILLVDRAIGDNPGLVAGDYILYELVSKKGSRIYANVCLRGLVGMHLVELERTRENTWKFCLYQAVTALLARTQFR